MAWRLNTDLMPRLGAPPPAPQQGLISSALQTGFGELLQAAGGGAQAFGRGLGIAPIENFGASTAAIGGGIADRNRRADLEVAPWREGGASFLPWLAYQALKQGPQLALTEAGARALPASAVPAALARVGTAAPRIMMGGGMRAAARAGATAEEIAAAEATGAHFARRAVSAQLTGMPIGAGSMYQEAESAAHAQGREVTRGEALTALAASPFYAALDTMDLNILSGVRNIARREGVRGLVKKVALGGLVGGATELPQEGIQTAMEQSFRTDLTTQQKMDNIIDGALTGFATGGAMAGGSAAMSVRAAQRTAPHDLTNDDLNHVVNEVLGLPAPTVTTDSAGRSAFGSGGLEDLVSTPITPEMSETDRQFAG